MIEELSQYFGADMAYPLLGVAYLLFAIYSGIHVVLNKQNEAAAFSWLGIIILVPAIGVLLYWLFGINRIKRRAKAAFSDYLPNVSEGDKGPVEALVADRYPAHWQSMMQLGFRIHEAAYLPGNQVTPLMNGDEAYPQMIDAINSASKSVVLSSYIFEFDKAGSAFVSALVNAHERGVSVRVLIDGVGVGYGFSLVRADRVLRKKGVRTARFLSTFSGTRFINLRNHRKILSVDGTVAFVGGMNIREGNFITDVLASKTASVNARRKLTQDVHFKVTGSVIDQINDVFASDWQFATEEKLALPRWTSSMKDADVTCRVLVDGPDDNYQKLQLTMVGAINAAQTRVQIVSPYFLPGVLLVNALQMAVMRGVTVDVCVPSKNNLPFVGWAMRANRRRLLEMGINIYETGKPFDHSKLFIVDDYWSLIGSSNWDSRSLELNFEINLECYDFALNQALAKIVSDKMTTGRQILDCSDQTIVKRLRNNFFRLFSPYL